MYQAWRRYRYGNLQTGAGFVVPAVGGGGGPFWTAIASVKAPTSGLSNVTTGAIDTSAADLIVMVLASFGIDPIVGDVSDSKSNTWTMLTVRGGGGGSDARCTIFYSRPTSVSTGVADHTFSYTPGVTTYCAVSVFALSGSVASPFDQENGSFTAAATSLATGSITPTQNGALIIAGLVTGAVEGSVPAINLSLTVRESEAYGAGNNMGSSLAWIEQTSIAAINPTWSWTNSIPAVAAIASFKHP